MSPEMETHIRELVDQAPPLTTEQRVRLAALLRPDAAAPLAEAS